LVGLTFSSLRFGAAPQVVLVLGVVEADGSWFSCLLLLLKGLWFWKNPLFFFTSCLSSSGDTGDGGAIGGAIGLPGDAEPLGGSMLENEVGFE
jgi:hypothetical protein